MPRIFIGLASLNAVALLLTFAVGLFSDGRSNLEAEGSATDAQELFTVHLLAGLATAVLTLLVHSMAYTYFMGTARWVHEVVVAYSLPESIYAQASALKSRTFLFVLVSMLLVITTAVCGAACDTGFIESTSHLTLAIAAIGFNFWSYVVEYRSIQANGSLLERVLSDVRGIRHEYGLE